MPGKVPKNQNAQDKCWPLSSILAIIIFIFLGAEQMRPGFAFVFQAAWVPVATLPVFFSKYCLLFSHSLYSFRKA
jgi:ABC-type Na+ efflux pump permease subunit